MHSYITETNVVLTTSKETAVKMLNNAIHNAGSDVIISIDETTDSINRKVKEVEKCLGFLLPDFLDEESIKECGFEEQQKDCRKEKEECDSWFGCYDWVVVNGIKENATGYMVELYAHVQEEVEVFGSYDWIKWGKTATHLYQCHIIMDKVYYCDGAFDSLSSYIFKVVDSEVEMKQISPTIDFQQLHRTYDELMTLDYTKYLQYKIDDFESMIESMKDMVEEMKADLENARKNTQ